MNNPMQSNYSPAPPTNTLAIVSLASGILSWFLFPFIGGVVAVVTGHMARTQIRDSLGAQTGDGLALAGLILGYAHLILGCLGLLLFVLFFGGTLGIGICATISDQSRIIFASDFITSLLFH
jgi:hypothetical protein